MSDERKTIQEWRSEHISIMVQHAELEILIAALTEYVAEFQLPMLKEKDLLKRLIRINIRERR